MIFPPFSAINQAFAYASLPFTALELSASLSRLFRLSFSVRIPDPLHACLLSGRSHNNGVYVSTSVKLEWKDCLAFGPSEVSGAVFSPRLQLPSMALSVCRVQGHGTYMRSMPNKSYYIGYVTRSPCLAVRSQPGQGLTAHRHHPH